MKNTILLHKMGIDLRGELLGLLSSPETETARGIQNLTRHKTEVKI